MKESDAADLSVFLDSIRRVLVEERPTLVTCLDVRLSTRARPVRIATPDMHHL